MWCGNLGERQSRQMENCSQSFRTSQELSGEGTFLPDQLQKASSVEGAYLKLSINYPFSCFSWHEIKHHFSFGIDFRLDSKNVWAIVNTVFSYLQFNLTWQPLVYPRQRFSTQWKYSCILSPSLMENLKLLNHKSADLTVSPSLFMSMFC